MVQVHEEVFNVQADVVIEGCLSHDDLFSEAHAPAVAQVPLPSRAHTSHPQGGRSSHQQASYVPGLAGTGGGGAISPARDGDGGKRCKNGASGMHVWRERYYA